MLWRLCPYIMTVVLPVAAQVTSALPADRLAFANQLSKRGMHAEALREYEAIRDAKDVPRDEVLFRLGETYRQLNRKKDALHAYGQLFEAVPESRYTDYARLNRALLMDGKERTDELGELDRDSAPPSLRAAALYYLGETAEASKENKKAITFYTRAAQTAGTNDVARLARLRSAALLAASDDAADRRRALATYLDLSESPDVNLAEEALFFAGMLDYREAKYSEAAALFHRLATRFPDGARTREARLYAAWANHLSGRPAEALALASPMRDGGEEDAWYLTAAALKALDRRREARAAYDAFLAKFPTGRFADAAWTERLSVIASMGDSAGVLAELSARGEPPAASADRAWSYGCEAAIATTNMALAVEYARLVARQEKSPLAPTAAHRLAWLLERMGDWSRAAMAYRGLAERWPKGPLAAQALFQAGVAETKTGRPAQARTDWTNLLTRYPDSPFAAEALYARAMEELRQKEYRAADRSLDELFTRFPKTPKRAEALYWRGVAASGSGEMAEAEKHLRAALAAKPSDTFEREITLELASVLQKRGADGEAAGLFAKLLGTKAVDRLPSGELQWVAESMLAVTNWPAALAAATAIEKRNTDAAWNQIGATLAGAAHEGAGERDAAVAAYGRALATGANTTSGAQAALALGRLETAVGLFDEAKAHLSDAVTRTQAKEHIAIRAQAYAALAVNEEERGDASAALGYHMLVGTLFDDPDVVPHALARAAAILRAQGKVKEADNLMAERKKRYPKAGEE